MRVRVFQNADGTVQVVIPSQKYAGREDDAFARTVEANPALAELSFVDMDEGDMPPRTEACADCPGGKHSVRDQWRLSSGKVVRDGRTSNPSRDAQHAARQRQQDMDAMLGQFRAKSETDPITGQRPA